MYPVDPADGDEVCLDYVNDAVAANAQTLILARVEALTRHSRLGEQLGHRMFVGHRAGPTGRYPLVVCCKRRLNLGGLDNLGRRQAFDGLQSPQVGERHDRRLLAA